MTILLALPNSLQMRTNYLTLHKGIEKVKTLYLKDSTKLKGMNLDYDLKKK